MIVKLFSLSLLLSAFPSDCQPIQSASDLSLNDTKFFDTLRQLSRWPSGEWNSSQWPHTQWDLNSWSTPNWRPSTASHGQNSAAVVNQKPIRSTLYPPLPDWPSSMATVAVPKSTRKPIVWSTSSRPVQTGQSRPSKAPTSPSPTTSQTPAPNNQSPSNNESFSITVKSCGLSHIPQVLIGSIGNKIVSGKVAKGGEFPWQVILKIHTARGPMQCGGSILNSRLVHLFVDNRKTLSPFQMDSNGSALRE